MTRLATLLLLAGLAPAAIVAADLSGPSAPLPTSPRVPLPELDQTGGVVPASGVLRVVVPVRERAGYLVRPASAEVVGQPLPTGYGTAGVPCSGPDCGVACGSSCGGASRSCLAKLKAWLCFQPTTGDALPKCRPTPYIGPVVGTFSCTSAGGCGGAGGCGPAGCGVAAGDGAGRTGLAGRFGPLLPLMPGRGCKGECVPPADDAVAGYRFAPTQNPAAFGHAQPVVHTSYKPARPPEGPYSGVKPAADPLSRPFTRP